MYSINHITWNRFKIVLKIEVIISLVSERDICFFFTTSKVDNWNIMTTNQKLI